MKIGIDFDRVLFKTEEFKEFLEQKIPGFIGAYPEEGVYNPGRHAESLGIEKEEIMDALGNADRFIRDDASELRELRPGHELVLVSRGDPAFQGRKITNSGVCELFDAVVVIKDGPKDRIDIDFLVDDADFEHERADVPGFRFDMRRHSVRDIVEKVRELEARKSV